METTEARSLVDHWLQALFPQGDIRLDDEGVCQFDSGEGVECLLEVADGEAAVRIYAPVLTVGCDSVFRKALELNLFQLATRGGCLALDSRTQNLAYQQMVEVALLDAAAFESLLASFVITAQQLQHELLDTGAAAAPEMTGRPDPANLA